MNMQNGLAESPTTGKFRRLAAVALLICVTALTGCQNGATGQQTLAPAQPLAQLQTSDLDYPPAGTILVWRNLNTGGTLEERVSDHNGRLYQSYVNSRRSFYYEPDPWADNENTDVADMAPLFPLQIGKSATFNRHPRAGKMTDTVKVVRAETLQLPLGQVDTFVIDTVSRLDDGSWTGNSTIWYAPALHSVVQIVVKDTDGDNRQRQLIEIRKP
ncbi:MAG TPA: hypothetical protein VN229_03580 [Terriglobales bacterium]|nr:hypothetical protein [Terriglobales bacterium]